MKRNKAKVKAKKRKNNKIKGIEKNKSKYGVKLTKKRQGINSEFSPIQ